MSKVEEIIRNRSGRKSRSSIPQDVRSQVESYLQGLKPGATVSASEISSVLYELDPQEKKNEAARVAANKKYYPPWAKARSFLGSFNKLVKRTGEEGSGEFVRL